MPTRVEVFAIYLGDNPIAQLNQPAKALRLSKPLVGELLRSMRADLLERPTGFHRTVRLAELPPLELEWVGAGQTAAVAVWSHKGAEPGTRQAGCVSLLLCGLDDTRERGDALAALASRRLPVPPDINVKLDEDRRRPLLVHVFYNLTYFFDPVLASVAPMLANAYFALLGINVEL